MFNMVRCLEITLERNPDGFESFEELKSAVKKTISEYIALMVRGCNACDLAHRETSPTPLLSVFIKDSLLNGRDITAGGARYNPSGVQGVGTANLADSLLVMKRTVFGQAADGSKVIPILSYLSFSRFLNATGRDQMTKSFGRASSTGIQNMVTILMRLTRWELSS